MLRRGQIVQVFEDPSTEKRFEAEAKLISKSKTRYAGGLEYWRVEFLDDGFRAMRWLKSEGKNTEG